MYFTVKFAPVKFSRLVTQEKTHRRLITLNAPPFGNIGPAWPQSLRVVVGKQSRVLQSSGINTNLHNPMKVWCNRNALRRDATWLLSNTPNVIRTAICWRSHDPDLYILYVVEFAWINCLRYDIMDVLNRSTARFEVGEIQMLLNNRKIKVM